MDAEDVARDFIQMLGDSAFTFTYSGNDYSGARGPLRKSNKLGEGGFADDFDLTIVTSFKKIDQNDLMVDRFASATAPAVGDLVTVDSVDYRVEELTFDQFTGLTQMNLMQK